MYCVCSFVDFYSTDELLMHFRTILATKGIQDETLRALGSHFGYLGALWEPFDSLWVSLGLLWEFLVSPGGHLALFLGALGIPNASKMPLGWHRADIVQTSKNLRVFMCF